MSKSQRVFQLLSMLSYTVALFLPGIATTAKDSDPIIGYECLLYGYNVTWTWLANPLLFVAWFLIWRGKPISAFVSLAALICSGSFLYLWLRPPPSGSFLIGGYFWEASMALATIAGVTTMLRFHKAEPASATS